MAMSDTNPYAQGFGESFAGRMPKARNPMDPMVQSPGFAVDPPQNQSFYDYFKPAGGGNASMPQPSYSSPEPAPSAGSFGAGSASPFGTIDSSSRARVEQSLFDRLQPQLDRQTSQARSALLNSGIEQNSDAYRTQMESIARQQNDARLGVIGAGGQEETRTNTLRAALQQQGFAQDLSAGQFDNNTRAQQLQELLLLRQQPLSELSALMGTQGQGPTSGSYYTSNANAPDFGTAASLQQNAKNQSNANRNAGWGAAANFGSALLDYFGGP